MGLFGDIWEGISDAGEFIYEDVIKEIPIIGTGVEAVEGVVSGVVGGLTGESDIGVPTFQPTPFEADPMAYRHPSARRPTLPPATPEEEHYLKAKGEADELWGYFRKWWREQGNAGEPTEADLRASNWTAKSSMIRQLDAIKEMEADPETWMPKKGPSLRGEILREWREEDTSGDWLLEGAQAPPREAAQLGAWEPGYMGETGIERGLLSPYAELEAEGRAAQMEALGLSREAALGLAPSQAEVLMQMGLDQATAAQLAAAGAARGGAGAAMRAQRIAAQQGAAARQASIREMAALRAGEMAEARAAFGLGAEQLRGGDIERYGQEAEMAVEEAGYRHEAAMENLRIENERDIMNLDAKLKSRGYDNEERAMYINAWLNNKGLNQQERQFLLSTVVRVDEGTLGATMARENAAMVQHQFEEGMKMGLSRAEAEAHARNYAASMQLLGTVGAAGIGAATGTPVVPGGGGPTAIPTGGFDWGQQPSTQAPQTFFGGGGGGGGTTMPTGGFNVLPSRTEPTGLDPFAPEAVPANQALA